ncbi:hypothetical protein GJ744_002358 [Endocarpon pusillum]|uniref:Uncharacterized protein n=1 Tax=Endocarpon pusillum TaxID=364733 RepID=A0A8H7ASF6_9EURO|nr:hypothetical protein GJ744_002358 [Endocarpon pusillum]
MAGGGDESGVEQMNQLLDYIRSNLKNIRCTWGKGSRQYASAVEMMEGALVENARRLRFEDAELDELMGRMELSDSKSNKEPAYFVLEAQDQLMDYHGEGSETRKSIPGTTKGFVLNIPNKKSLKILPVTPIMHTWSP